MNNLHYNVALEAIDFQRDAMLLKELALHIAAMQGTQDTSERLEILKRLDATAFHHTKMKFRFHLQAEKTPNACIIVAESNSAAPMRPNVIRDQVRKSGGICSEKEFFKGSVNLKTGQVSGIYSEIPLDIFFATGFLIPTRKNTMFTPEEVAAVLIHEMGHGLMYLRYLGGMVISNIVVAEIVRNINSDADVETVRKVIKVDEQKTGWKISDMGTVDKNPDPLLVQQVVMAEMISSIRSDLGTRYYDARAFEFVADQFAARHGGAAHIVSALDRMYRDCGWTPLEYSGRISHMVAALANNSHAVVGAAITWMTAGAGFAIVGLVVGVIVGVAFATALTALVGGDIYDDIPNRFNAMRRELIASSKDQTLTKETRIAIIEEINVIDKVMENITPTTFGPGFFSGFFAGVFTGKTAQMKFMRQLEELANNRLFELSNQLQAKA